MIDEAYKLKTVDQIHSDQNGYERWISYDENGNISEFRDNKNNHIITEYDSKNRVLHCNDICNNYEYWNEYDMAGNLIYYKNNKGLETGIKADNLNRLRELEIMDIDNMEMVTKIGLVSIIRNLIHSGLFIQPDGISATNRDSMQIEFNLNDKYIEFEFYNDRIEVFKTNSDKEKQYDMDYITYISEINKELEKLISNTETI